MIYPAMQQPRRLAWTGDHFPRATWRDITFLASWPCQAIVPLHAKMSAKAVLPARSSISTDPLCTPMLSATGCGSPYKQHVLQATYLTSSPTPFAYPHPWLPVTTHLCPTTPEPQRVVPCLPSNRGPALTWAYHKLHCHPVCCNYNFSNKV